MNVDLPQFAGAFMMTGFIGLALVLSFAALFKPKTHWPSWIAGAVGALFIGLLSSFAAGVAVALIFIVMALLNRPPPKFS